MQKTPQEEEPIIAEEYMIGNTKIRIATNYCVAPDEVQPILDRIAQRALAAFSAQYYQEQCQRKEGRTNENGQSDPSHHRICG